ncbi:MAG: DNA helicase [Acidimicrobiia bacterium]|nr:MAG: DNA helicase [Acidimicrobiia bacterium]
MSVPFGTVARVGDPLLDDLDPAQREAVTSTASPLAIVAPAGSGKTRVLTRRIAWRVREGSADAAHVLAVTFTRKAAGELTERLGRLGADRVTAGTFHALALAQLRRRAAEQGREPPVVVGSKARVLGPVVQGTPVSVADAAAEIEWAKAAMCTPDGYAAAARRAGRRTAVPPTEMAEIYARYETAMRRRRACDFDDLLWWCADAIERDPLFAAAQRFRFRHLFVDEFQDATPLQVRLLRAWLGDRDDLCVVGDTAQAIYGFAGADAGVLGEFGRHFPGGTTIRLTRNYRSTPQVVAASASVLGRPAAPEAAGDPGADAAPVRAVRPDGAAPSVTEYADDDAEAAGVAQACWRAFTHGVPWDRMAVLFRTNAQAARFEAAFERRGIPYRRPGAGRVTDRGAARHLLDELRRAERELPGRPFADHLADLAAGDDLPPPDGDPDAYDAHDASDASDASAAPGGPGGRAGAAFAPEELAAQRAALVRLGREYLAAEGGRGTLGGFLAWLDVATRADPPGGRGVDLVTFHGAKGLEWSVVFVTGLERGLVPIAWATSPEALAEERRLLHVALSRAHDELHCSYARRRGPDGRPKARRDPSPWLDPLRRQADEARGHSVDPRAELAAVRATLAAARPPRPRRRHRLGHPGPPGGR